MDPARSSGVPTFRALTRPPGSAWPNGVVWVHMDELTWILQRLREELNKGGVEYQPQETKLRIHFSIRDSAWRACAKDVSGEVVRKGFPVSKWITSDSGLRRPVSREEFAQRKEQILEEAREWVKGIQVGDD